jgi:mannose-6-phosphate isomerase
MRPVPLERNCPPQFYRGGHRILAFRGEPASDDENLREPEDWLASTTALFAGGRGPSTLPDGRLLSEAIDADPSDWLGPDHQLRFGMEPGLLVKLLDAAERLPVHAHPDQAFAARYLGSRHGKTEAWLVLDADPDASVWLGFSDYVDAAELRSLVDAEGEELLGLLHEVPVRRGDAIVVPAGLPHAIGAGVFVLELQEPTDFSVMLERGRFDLAVEHAYLGLDVDVALRSVTRTPLELDALEALRTRWVDDSGAAGQGVRSALAVTADPYFRAEVIRSADAPVDLPAGFSVLVVVEGAGKLTASDGEMLDLASGQVHVTPHASGVLRLEGDTTVVRCQPPVGPHNRYTPADAPGTRQ